MCYEIIKNNYSEILNMSSDFVYRCFIKLYFYCLEVTKHQEEVAPLLNYSYAVEHLEGLDYSEVRVSTTIIVMHFLNYIYTKFLF